MKIVRTKLAKWLLLLVLVFTVISAYLFVTYLGSLGIAIHDTLYMALAEETDAWVDLTDDIFHVLSPVLFIPLLAFTVWIITGIAMLILLKTKKEKSNKRMDDTAV